MRERLAGALERAGRRDEVAIVAVTKGHGAEAVEALLAAGLDRFGENRVQELEAKVAAVGRDRGEWHLIGHLQRNKVRRALPLFDLIHSIDSLRLAQELSKEAERAGRTVTGLVQVNTSGEATKGGLPAEEAVEGVGQIVELPGLRIQGLDDDGAAHRRRAGDPSGVRCGARAVRSVCAAGLGVRAAASLNGDVQRL